MPFVHNMDPSNLRFDGLHHIQGLLKPGFGSGKLSVPNHSAVGQHVNRHDLLVAGFIMYSMKPKWPDKRLPEFLCIQCFHPQEIPQAYDCAGWRRLPR